MDRTGIEKYYLSVSSLKELMKQGIINESDYAAAESFFAKKYCIKKGNLYRRNGLINNDFRGIYMTTKEDKDYGNDDDKENRSITEIRKEN